MTLNTCPRCYGPLVERDITISKIGKVRRLCCLTCGVYSWLDRTCVACDKTYYQGCHFDPATMVSSGGLSSDHQCSEEYETRRRRGETLSEGHAGRDYERPSAFYGTRLEYGFRMLGGDQS